MEVLLLLVFWFLCALFSGLVAESRGRSGPGWFVVGALCGPFGLLVGAMPDKRAERAEKRRKESEKWARERQLRREGRGDEI
ncbi:MAG: hypothetical protein F4X36_09550 [Gammaproteobacteria bacterium]|nr:hypothetical protein [Gammaproteobacteria bacterium]